MKIKLNNGKEFEALGVQGYQVTHQGVSRDCLTFLFDKNVMSLSDVEREMTPDACGRVVIVDDDGEYVHEHYTIRVELGMSLKSRAANPGSPTVSGEEEVVYCRMAQSTVMERMLLSQQSVVDALIKNALEG